MFILGVKALLKSAFDRKNSEIWKLFWLYVFQN